MAIGEKMIINGLSLPGRFADCIASKELHRKIGSWGLRSTDAYGNQFEAELGLIFDTVQTITKATADLPINYEADGCYGEEDGFTSGAGCIPDIVNFSKIVCFGISGDGAPFCFDFREGKDPSILWWDDVYWRRLTPDFNSFLQLIVK